MAEIIKSITNPNEFPATFTEYFQNKDVFIKTPEMNVSVKFLEYKDGMILLEIPSSSGIIAQTIIFVSTTDTIIAVRVKLTSQKSGSLYLFHPENIQMIKIPSKEERKSFNINHPVRNENIFISNIISDFVIRESLSRETKRFESISEPITIKLKEQFKYSRVFYINEKSNDDRMLYFLSKRQPIFIPDLQKKDWGGADLETFEFYRMKIFDRDRMLDWKLVTSEISVPLLYHTMLPFGYIQVNDQRPLTENELTSLKKLCASTSEYITANNIIKT